MAAPFANAVDDVIESIVPLSFTRSGYALRSRLYGWTTPPALDGQTIVVTGATSGLVRDVAFSFAARKARVILVGRDRSRCERVADEIATASPGARTDIVVIDMASQVSIRDGAAVITGLTPRVDVLVHNAGAITQEWTSSPDGLEVTVAAQVVGPHLLTSLLLSSLEASGDGKVITVTSGGMYTWQFSLANLVMTPAEYDDVKAYARAKRAQVILAHAWANRGAHPTVRFVTMHPGWAATPGLAHALPAFYRVLRPFLRTPAQGADTVLWLAASPNSSLIDGALYFDRRPRSEHKLKRTRPVDADADQTSLWDWCATQVRRSTSGE